MGSNDTDRRGRVALSAVLVCALVLAAVAPAAAAPRIFITDADLESERALAGERVNVTVDLENSGDGGALSVDVTANDTVVAERRVSVEANSERTVTTNFTVDDPGTYRIRVNDEGAGWLTVGNAVAETVEERADGRTSRVRVVGASSGASVTADFAENDDDVAVRSLTMTTDRSSFDRRVATYAPPGNASFPVPNGSASTALGALTLEPVSDVDDDTVRVSVDRSLLSTHGVAASDVGAYSYDDGTYRAVPTGVVETTNSQVTYEVEANGSAYVIGVLRPEMVVRERTVNVTETDEGWRFALDATVENVGPVDGEYAAAMAIDGESVDNGSVEVSAGETGTVEFEHVVTESGTYDVGLDGDVVRTVAVSGGGSDGATTDGSNSETGADGSDGDSPTATDGGDGASGDGLSVDVSVPSVEDLGVRNVVIGASVAVLAGGVALIRRL
ncbi:CARDB domain-containing protein [Halomicrobium salinisoli]|uniref:CARDB domain-containing protein n=1 Tax=Halomicrobium salinisoli TaxID=2878391 RepID=UPI001CF0B4EF|nr:CARDB domain-containing protein [Halomicrobium salinisoli]